MKTIREWLDTLHEPVKTHAKTQINVIWQNPKLLLDKTTPTLEKAIRFGIMTNSAPYSDSYWLKVINEQI